MPTLSVGKWFNPYWEFVYKVQAVHCTDLLLALTQCCTINMVLFTQTLCSGLINFFAPYKENRRFDIVPFAVLVEHLFVKATSRLQSMQVSRHVTVSQNVSILTLNTKELSWMTIWWFAVVFRMMESAV